MDKAVSYQLIPNLGDKEELLFKCEAYILSENPADLREKCGQEVHASALRTHAAMVHDTTMYVTDMVTVRDDKRFVVQ